MTELHKSDLFLERLAADEHGHEPGHAPVGPEVEAEVARLKDENRRILESYPPRREVLAILRKVDQVRRQQSQARRRAVLTAVPVCAALGLLFTVGPGLLGPDRGPEERTKGPAVLQVFRRTAAGEERLSAGARVQAQDLLQLRYDARGLKYGAIVSVDGSGVVTPHLPDRLDGPSASLGKALVAVPSAYELDDAPGYERFFFVTAAEPFEVGVVVEAIRRLGTASGPLELPDGLRQVSLRLEKEQP